MTESRFEEMKRYVRFDGAAAERLARLRPIAAPYFETIAREFYDRIREHEAAHAVLESEEQILRQQKALVAWMHRLCSGKYDASYYEETSKIGRVHVRIGLPQRYMFTAMALIRAGLTGVVERHAAELEDPRATSDALSRLLDLELAIMLEAYQESYVTRLEHVGRMEKQELRRAFARTEHRYVKAVELAGALIVGLDASGDVRLFNREAERVTGFARDEVVGLPFVATFFPEDVRASYTAAIERVVDGAPASQSLVTTLRTRAGKLRDVAWHLAYASDDDDEVVVFAVGNDVTDAKALELRARQAEKLAAVGTLAAGLAHEIRNPLNGAQLHLAFLDRAIKKRGGDAEMLEATHVVSDEIKRLAMLVSEFLDFARPRPLQRRTTSAVALVTRVRDLVAPAAAAAAVKVIADLPTADVELSADPSKLEQVVLNLSHNAVEALAPNGGGNMILRMRRQPRAVLFEVEDDGPGIPAPDAPIFDAFFTTKPGGTGLGLAITHRIVTDHRGTIDVTSKPGKTVFRVSLPLIEGAEE